MFQPVVPLGGVAGLRLLESTRTTQQEAFNKSPQIERNVAAFKERIGGIATAEALVADRQLFEVALGAFGLDEEINKTYFMRKMLEEGTDDPESLANKFVDPRYRRFSETFGFGNLTGPRTADEGFADFVVQQYRVRQFEIAVGNSDPSMRLAIGFKREIARVLNSDFSDNAAWFTVMGDKPLRSVFEGAYGLPPQFATQEVEKQREVLRDRTRQIFGDEKLSVFDDPAKVDELVDRFLALSQAASGPTGTTPGVAALTLLSGASGFGASSRINIILSNAIQA